MDIEVINDIREGPFEIKVETDETSMMIEEYAVSIWVRWVDNLIVEEENVF